MPDLIGSHQARLARYQSTVSGRPPSPNECSRRPAERPQLRVVDRVAAIVARPVLDVADQGRVGAGQLEDAVGDLDVLVVLAADVVDLTRRALVEDELDPGAVILGVQPLPHLLAVAVDGQRLALERVRDEERDELLRVLVRAICVGAAGDRGADAVGAARRRAPAGRRRPWRRCRGSTAAAGRPRARGRPPRGRRRPRRSRPGRSARRAPAPTRAGTSSRARRCGRTPAGRGSSGRRASRRRS